MSGKKSGKLSFLEVCVGVYSSFWKLNFERLFKKESRAACFNKLVICWPKSNVHHDKSTE